MLPPSKRSDGAKQEKQREKGKKGEKTIPLPTSGKRKSFRTAGEKLNAALDLLESQWHNEGLPPDLQHEEPLDGLILTILSQHTNDRNRDFAFDRLKERWPSWEETAAAGYDALEEAIRPAGLAPTKARRILEVLEIVRADFGCYSILSLVEKGRDEARRYLLSLPGVGAKTAACVLVFDMGLPAFPVDTHIARVCRRLGLVPEETPPEEICALLEKEAPPSRYLGGHVNIIEHGRAVCRARGPLCGKCVLSGLCDFRSGK
ncbi:MAG: endonuclease III [Synergistaceae bacterium]|nr:endonuclease III [Synergistaceae bacterium]